MSTETADLIKRANERIRELTAANKALNEELQWLLCLSKILYEELEGV